MSMRDPVTILVVDDSAVFRVALTRALAHEPGLRVIGSVASAQAARDFIAVRRPDVIALDIEMPGENGLEFLKAQMASDPIRTVVISSLTARGTRTTIAALEAGAIDVAAKPTLLRRSEGPSDGVADIAMRLRAAASARLVGARAAPGTAFAAVRPASAAPSAGAPAASGVAGAARPPEPPVVQPALPSAAHLPADWVIAIGSSTGGVQALTRILPEFPADTPPIVIVQHMPEGFTAAFARRLDGLCPMQVREAADGDTLERGRILIAPGGLRHMQLVTAGGRPRVALVEGDPVSYSRPSVDVLFTALARVCPTRCSAAILTGMGSDGAAGLLAIRQAGGRTFAQDEASSQIYGMPARAWERGGAEDQVPLSQMVPRLLGSVRAGLAAGYPRQPALP